MPAPTVRKTCNCCLDRNKQPVHMGARAKVRYCRSCNARTIWSEADADFLAEYDKRRAESRALIEAFANS